MSELRYRATIERDDAGARAELVQVAAVAVKWVEWVDLGRPGGGM